MKVIKEIAQGALIALMALALVMLIAMQNARAAEAEFVVIAQHTSDIARGCPMHCDQTEPTQDYYAIGATITVGARKAFEIDVTTGVKAIDCNYRKRCPFEGGSQITARWYPGRIK